MSATISSRTPEGVPNRCPICHAAIRAEPSLPPGDAPCPNCGSLLWFLKTEEGMRYYDYREVAPLVEKLQAVLQDVNFDSLDVVELIMELEEDFEMTIPDDEAARLKTAHDLVNYVLRSRQP